jgi:hypothetical protein
MAQISERSLDSRFRSYYVVIARRGVSDTFAFARRELLVGLVFAVITGFAEGWLDPDAKLGSIVGSALMAFRGRDARGVRSQLLPRARKAGPEAATASGAD